MKTDDFDYFLPEDLIAQTPLKDRASSRLLVVDKKSGELEDRHFSDILDYLKPGDALVLNETKVIPARIIGVKAETDGAVELLLLKELENDVWECLARPQKRLHEGTKILFGNSKAEPDLTATVLETLDEGLTRIKFDYTGIFLEILEKLGIMPLPPYIHEQLKDQCLAKFAQKNGWVSQKEVDATFADIAKRYHMSVAEFEKFLTSKNIKKDTLLKRIKTEMSWVAYINARYGKDVNISENEAKKAAAEIE